MNLEINRIEQIQLFWGLRRSIRFERKILRMLDSDETIRMQIAEITALRELKRRLR